MGKVLEPRMPNRTLMDVVEDKLRELHKKESEKDVLLFVTYGRMYQHMRDYRFAQSYNKMV